ncbi:MAG TPA: GrpB family protein, partial [Rhabdochlamydiaceae bacterium]
MSLNTARPVLVIPYQKSWPHAFEEEAQKLKKGFSSLPSHFYHIGSTSIPGCSAKPIVDILGVVADVTRVDDFNAVLFEQGFEPLGEYGMKQRRFFRKRSGVQVNVHIFEDTDPEVERHLRFCDYLRRHPDAVKAYCELKSKLAEQFTLDRGRYTLGKEKFIKTIDIAAAKEADHFFAIALKNPQRKNRWTLHEIIEAMEANKHLHMTSFTKYIHAIERVFEPDVTVVRSEIPSDTFNYILDANFTSENASERVAHVLELYRSAQLPFSWWLGEGDTPKELESVLMAQGLKFKEGNVGMYLDLDLFTPPAKLATMQFIRAMQTAELRDFSQVIVAVGEDPKAFDQLY